MIGALIMIGNNSNVIRRLVKSKIQKFLFESALNNLFLEEKNRIQNKQDTIFNSFNAIQRLLRNQTLADTYRSDGDRRRHCRHD